jgi:hypothetical protein
MHSAQCCLTCVDSTMDEVTTRMICHNTIIRDGHNSPVNPFGCCFDYDDETLTEKEKEKIIRNFLEQVCKREHITIWKGM